MQSCVGYAQHIVLIFRWFRLTFSQSTKSGSVSTIREVARLSQAIINPLSQETNSRDSDFLPPAPPIFPKFGLEWLYRLCKEPRRLFRRYFTYNSLFVYYSLRNWNHKREVSASSSQFWKLKTAAWKLLPLHRPGNLLVRLVWLVVKTASSSQ